MDREKNSERKAFYELAWHLGASQSDVANLHAEDVDCLDYPPNRACIGTILRKPAGGTFFAAFMIHPLQIEHMITFTPRPQSFRIRASWTRWLLLLAGALSFSPLLQVRAADVSGSSEVSVGFNHGESGGAQQQNSGDYDADISFTDPDTQDLYFGNGSASVSANSLSILGATAELPDLHAYAHALPNGNSEQVEAQATFSDSLIFNAPAVNTVKVFHLNFLISGSLSGNSQAIFNVQWGNIDSNGIVITDSSSAGLQELTLSVPSDDLTTSLDGSSVGGSLTLSLSAAANNTIPFSTDTEDSVSDFSDTVQLISADALDANGDAVQGSFSDGGQILFPANTVFVTTPEPATLLLLAPALGLLVAFGRRLPHSRQSV